MRKLIKIYTIILSSLLWLNSLAHSGMVTDKVREAVLSNVENKFKQALLEEMGKNSGQLEKILEVALSNIKDKGRQALLKEMGKFSGQLENDIHRHQTIKVQGVEIITEKTKKIDTESKADTIYIDILDELKRNCPENINCKNNIGPFSAAEIMFPMVQNFLSIPMKLYKNFYGETHFDVLNGEWVPRESSQTVSIEFSKKYAFFGDDLLIVNYNENKPYVAMNKFLADKSSSPNRWLKNNSKTIFNLTTGKVEFTFSYNDSYLPILQRSYEITTTTLSH